MFGKGNLIDIDFLIDKIKIKKNKNIDNNSIINKTLDLFKFKKVLFIVLVVFGGIVGQVLTRIFYLDGSLDKWYLLIPPFSKFPISLYPGYILYNNDIKKGVGGAPYDDSILLPALGSGILTMLIDSIFGNTIAGAIFKFMVNMICIGYALYYKDDIECNLETPHIDKIIVNSIIFVSLMPLMPILFSYIPYFDKILGKISGTSKYSEMIANWFIKFVSIILMYIIYNIYNGLYKIESCKKNYKGKHHELIVYVVIGLVINIIIGSGKSDE